MRAATQRRGNDPLAGVWPENVTIVQAFLLASTQWRTASVGGPAGSRVFWVGLDYSAARVAIETAGLILDAPVFAGLQVMEMAARGALNGVEE